MSPSATKLGSRAAQRIEQVGRQVNTDPTPEVDNAVPAEQQSIMAHQMPTTRRIVTDHTRDGKAIIGSDAVLQPANPIDPEGGPPLGTFPGFTNIFRTSSHPASAQGSWEDPHGKLVGLVGSSGVVCRIVDFPPLPAGEEDSFNIMHRTLSVDYGVVLKGEIELILDDGISTLMKEGDVVVQRGTIHHWKNTSKENCRIFFVLVPAQPIVVETTGEKLQGTDTRRIEESE